MDNVSLMMELELLKRSLYNSYEIAIMKIDRILVQLRKEAQEEKENG